MTAPVRPAEQPDLFLRSDSRLERAFADFHFANPHVLAMLRSLALQYQSTGKRVGIGHLYEVARYERHRTTGDWFKLNNNWRSRYARLLMDTTPALAGYFDTRELTG